ncbi:MAG TPA: class I SAM-dependent methyltransferase [Candidatus Udaeobacter sp.]|jgi:ubiquinone/menaquinone biosynthesis C-methylase UbiE|nr:class I SAM-dependent methyltransferase [Candidatus Udaeobacter sp.]
MKSNYPLGHTDAEHDRLIRQAACIAPITERFFREAGVGPGQRVLELGSGVGDVAMLVARLVGPSGEVVAIERDPRSIAKASARVTEAGFRNVKFNESNVDEILDQKPFDAALGRFILMYLPDPVATLRSISQVVRPGGVFVFQEPCWVPVLAHLKSLPLWFATVTLIDKAMRTSANHDMGTDLYRTFVEAGLPAPTMRMEVPMGKEPYLAQWYYDTLCSLLPRIEQLQLSIESLGSLDTLVQRLQAEVSESKTVACWFASVGAWCRKPQAD